jgi:hypothetical protein
MKLIGYKVKDDDKKNMGYILSTIFFVASVFIV